VKTKTKTKTILNMRSQPKLGVSTRMAAWCCRSVGLLIHKNNFLTIVPDLLGTSALRLVNKCFSCYGRDAEGTCAFQGHTESWSVSTALTVLE
jgi:hypothetical protein